MKLSDITFANDWHLQIIEFPVNKSRLKRERLKDTGFCCSAQCRVSEANTAKVNQFI